MNKNIIILLSSLTLIFIGCVKSSYYYSDSQSENVYIDQNNYLNIRVIESYENGYFYVVIDKYISDNTTIENVRLQYMNKEYYPYIFDKTLQAYYFKITKNLPRNISICFDLSMFGDKKKINITNLKLIAKKRVNFSFH